MSISDQLREAIRNYGSMYAVSRDSGVSESSLHRFMTHQRDLYLETVDRLCELFEMHLTRPKRCKDQSPYKRKR